MTLVQCISTVIGKKEAQELVTDLNKLKSAQSETFYIEHDEEDTYRVVGNVTEEDWNELNLDMDFLEVGVL